MFSQRVKYHKDTPEICQKEQHKVQKNKSSDYF